MELRKTHDLHPRIVAITINPSSGKGARAGVAKSRACEQLDVLQVLPVATNINPGAAKPWILYKC
jgi:hypothetical protein